MIARMLLVLVVISVVAVFYLYGVVGGQITPQTVRTVTPGREPIDNYRIAIFGTSLTHRGNWVERLETRLEECNQRVTIDTISRPGASSRWGRNRVAEVMGAADTFYDIVIYEFSGNDASLAKGFPLFVSQRLHREMITTARATGATVLLATMSPAWGRNAWVRPGQARYHALYRDLAATLGTGLIDTIADWRALPDDTRLMLVPDGLHPTDAGMARITIPAFEAALRPLVCGMYPRKTFG